MRKIKLLLVALFAVVGSAMAAIPTTGDVGYLYNSTAKRFLNANVSGDGTGILFKARNESDGSYSTVATVSEFDDAIYNYVRFEQNDKSGTWLRVEASSMAMGSGYHKFAVTETEDGLLIRCIYQPSQVGYAVQGAYLAFDENGTLVLAEEKSYWQFVPEGDDYATLAAAAQADYEDWLAAKENAAAQATKDALAAMNEGAGPQAGDELLAILFPNAGFDASNNADGWNVTMNGGNNPSYKVENGNCGLTKYQGTLKVEKTIKGLPAGWYTLKAQAFGRKGNFATNKTKFEAGEELETPGVIFANGVTKQVPNAFDGLIDESDGRTFKTSTKQDGRFDIETPSVVQYFGQVTVDGVNKYVLDNSNSGSYVFSLGEYQVELIVYLAEGEALTFGFDKTTADTDDYCGCDNFELIYEGDAMPQTFADGKYYLYNPASGKFWGAGNDWGTRASLVDHAEFITLHYAATGYTFESQVSNGGTSYYFGGDYMDGGAKSLFIVPFGKYYKVYANDAVYGYDGTSTILGKNVEGDAAAWQIFSEEDMKAQLAKATAKEPVDATWLILDPNFGRNNRNQSAWTIDASNKNLSGGNNVNNCAESFHSLFTLTQTITGAPKGTYTLTAQGFYRQDGSDNENLPVFYANDKTGTFPLKTGSDNSMADASESFAKGQYTIKPFVFEVGEDGVITLGAKLENNTELWCIWDNFVITYYGPDATPLEVEAAAAIDTYKAALAAAQAVDQTAKMAQAPKLALAEALATYPEDVVLVEGATRESIEEAAAALEAATKAAATSINSYKIIAAGVVPDNSLDGWVCENSNTFHINTWSTEGNPGNDPSGMVTPFIENWVGKGSFLGAGKVYYQLAGLEPGEVYYAQALVRSYNEANADAPNGPNFFINDTYVDMTEAGNTFTYNNMSGIYATLGGAATVGEDGTLTLGVEINADRNYNWVAFKSVSIMPMENALIAALEAAKAYDGETTEEAATDLANVIALYDGATFNTAEEYTTAIEAINGALEAAKAAAAQLAFNKANEDAIKAMKELMESTNVYTADAYETYNALYEDYLAKFEAGTLEEQVVNPNKTQGWHSANTYDDFLLSAWTIGDAQCQDFNTALYINTWSNEGAGKENGSGVNVPFFEYWTSDDSSLGANTIQATMTDLEDGVYDVEALVRVRIKNDGGEEASGITLTAASGTPVDVCAGVTCDDGTQFRYGVFTAEGEITDGTLTITFDVAEGNNISWLSFKNVKFEKVGEPTKIAGVTEKAAQKAIFNAAGQQMKNLQKGINIVDGAKVYVK